MSTIIGIIAEDQSDIDTLYAFACNLVEENSFKFKHFVGHGCGKLRKKCGAWAENLRTRGCEYLILVHDLDDRMEQDLREELTSRVRNVGFRLHLVLIPIRELEAWLLCDSSAIKAVFRTKTLPTTPNHPESVKDPKAELRKTVRKAGGHAYVNTIHNKQIARTSRVEEIKRRCPSFSPYVEFMRTVLS